MTLPMLGEINASSPTLNSLSITLSVIAVIGVVAFILIRKISEIVKDINNIEIDFTFPNNYFM